MTNLQKLCYAYFFCGLFCGLMFAAVAIGQPAVGALLAVVTTCFWLVSTKLYLEVR